MNNTHALTIDVEDYFQVEAFSGCIERSSWDTRPCRVERNADVILAAMDCAGVKGTFFTLGWIAERYPRVVKSIVEQGHELASHGYGHHSANALTREAFRDDVRRAKSLLEDLVGRPVIGYRAPSFSVGPKTLWALDEVAEAGYVYSSSIYPIKHDLYGMPQAPRGPFRPRPDLLEIPMTTLRVGERNVPVGGGGFFRLFPYALSRGLRRAAQSRNDFPGMFYAHPWEFDPEQPRIDAAPAKSRFRHYLNLRRTLPRFETLLRDFSWGRVDSVFNVQSLARSAPLVPLAT